LQNKLVHQSERKSKQSSQRTDRARAHAGLGDEWISKIAGYWIIGDPLDLIRGKRTYRVAFLWW